MGLFVEVLQFLIVSVFVVFGRGVVRWMISVSVGTSCVPLAKLLLCEHGAYAKQGI